MDMDREINALKLKERMSRIGQKILILSGKGGVGKSTVATNLAVALAATGKSVGLLDIDIHGPSVPVMLGLESERPAPDGTGLSPVVVGNLKVMSIGFLLERMDNALIWRGPMKMGVIEQFLRDVAWGDLDVLVVDAPPGTGDEPLSIAQFLPDAQAVIVTTPQKVATVDVRKSISFCRAVSIPVLGLVENMNGLVCPDCGKHITVFPKGQAERMAEEMGVPILASLPLDPAVAAGGDTGQVFVEGPDSPVRTAIAPLVRAVLDLAQKGSSQREEKADVERETMRIAIPTAEGRLCNHFGHCDAFVFIDVDLETRSILKQESVTPPAHEPGVYPRWVGEQGARLVLAGGMGGRAIDLFAQAGVEVLTGCPAIEPEALVKAYCAGTLTTGANVCGHDANHKCGH